MAWFFMLAPAPAQTAAVAVTPGIITTVAGNGTAGDTGNGGLATSAEIGGASAVAFDGSGNLYIMDTGNLVVRKVTASTGDIAIIAGNKGACPTPTATCGDGGPATSASLSTTARGIFVTSAGVIYIADGGDNRIRMVSTTGIMTTIAGNGTAGYTGNGSSATAAELNAPRGVWVNSSGVLYITDSGNNVVRTVTNGVINVVAGGATTVCTASTDAYGDGCSALQAQFNLPNGIWGDASGDIFITDSTHELVRKINSAGVITAVAGKGSAGSLGDGGAATAAELNNPQNAVTDGAGDIFIADYSNNRIQYVNGSGIISTIVGTGITSGFSGDGGLANAAALYEPHGVILDAAGNLYIADSGNDRIRKVNIFTSSMAFGNIGINLVSPAQTVTLTASGSGPTTITGYTVPAPLEQVPSGATDCAPGLVLQSGKTCELSIAYAPTTIGTINDTITIATTATNAPQGNVTIAITGTSVYEAAIQLIITPTSTYAGQTVSMAAQLSGALGTPTGTVSFYSGTTLLQSGVAISNTGVANYSTAALAVGTDNITVRYSGDSNYPMDTSAAVPVIIYAGPPNFTIVPASYAFSVQPGIAATLNVAVTAIFGYSGSPTLTCLNLPVNMTCSFYPYTVTLATNASVNTLLGITTTTTPPGLGGQLIGTKSTITVCLLLPLLALRVRRRRRWHSALLAVIACVALVGFQGCSSPSAKSNTDVAAGTYNITIQGTAPGLTNTAVISVTVQ